MVSWRMFVLSPNLRVSPSLRLRVKACRWVTILEIGRKQQKHREDSKTRFVHFVTVTATIFFYRRWFFLAISRTAINNKQPSFNTVSFMSVIASTSGRLHSEFVRLLFLQVHRETDHFFYSFRSSASTTYLGSWPVPLPSLGFRFTDQKEGFHFLKIYF
jgi:hypothetical protein